MALPVPLHRRYKGMMKSAEKEMEMRPGIDSTILRAVKDSKGVRHQAHETPLQLTVDNPTVAAVLSYIQSCIL